MRVFDLRPKMDLGGGIDMAHVPYRGGAWAKVIKFTDIRLG